MARTCVGGCCLAKSTLRCCWKAFRILSAFVEGPLAISSLCLCLVLASPSRCRIFQSRLFVFSLSLSCEPFEFFFGCHRHFLSVDNRLQMCRLPLEISAFFFCINLTLSVATIILASFNSIDFFFSENPKYL